MEARAKGIRFVSFHQCCFLYSHHLYYWLVYSIMDFLEVVSASCPFVLRRPPDSQKGGYLIASSVTTAKIFPLMKSYSLCPVHCSSPRLLYPVLTIENYDLLNGYYVPMSVFEKTALQLNIPLQTNNENTSVYQLNLNNFKQKLAILQ